MSGRSAKSIFHPPIETPFYAVSPTARGGVGFGTGSPPSAVKTTALSVKDDRVSAWPRATAPLLLAFEKTAMAADRTNIKSATWIRSFVICVSLKRVGTRKAWIVTPPSRPLASLWGKPERCAVSRYLVGIPTRTRAARSCRRIKYSRSKKNREELQRQKQNSNCNVLETATSKGCALHSAFLVTPARIYDCAVLARISRNCRLVLPAGTFGGLNL